MVIGISILLTIIAIASFTSRKNLNDLGTTVSQAAALLREAESRSATEAQGVAWGVHFANATKTAPFYALFSSSTYSTSTTVGYYSLPRDVSYTTATIATGSMLDVIFNQVSGLPSSSAAIGFMSLSQKSLASDTISVASSGAITY